MLTQNLDDRRQLISEQNEEYCKSLETERELERRMRAKLSEEASLLKRQVEVMLARKDRVPEEPRQGEDRVVVRVRHAFNIWCCRKILQARHYAGFNLRLCWIIGQHTRALCTV